MVVADLELSEAFVNGNLSSSVAARERNVLRLDLIISTFSFG